jgi:diguanylate cyclase (GGDEF)-like protein
LLRASEADPPACVLLLDLDNFKRINDQAGHTTGDQVLQATARTLLQTVRAQDSVVRWGGEEFLICLPRTHLQEGCQAAEKIRRAIAALTDPLPVTVSIGLTELRPKQNIGRAADQADVGLLRAKEAGRNRVCVAP